MYYTNPTSALVDCLRKILDKGEVIDSRAGKVKELTGVHLTIEHPLERCFVLPHRNDNIFAKIAESLWVIAGRNDIEWLSYYLPRAPEYSDDGKTWRGGYGPRLRGTVDCDPLHEVVNILTKDCKSRRAVISLWNNFTDYKDSLDIPCNDVINFLIRDNKLNMYVFQRSSDAIFGFSGINTFEWATLMQMMAFWTGTQVGKLEYFISSMHIYEHHWKRAQDIVDSFRGITIYSNFNGVSVIPAGGFATPFDSIDKQLDVFFKAEHDIRTFDATLDALQISMLDPFLLECLKMLELYVYIQTTKAAAKVADVNVINLLLEDIKAEDFKLAAIEYMVRTKVILLSDVQGFEAAKLLKYFGAV